MRTRRILCASVLVAESLVIVFAMLVALPLSDVPRDAVLAVGGAGAVACLLLAGLLRHRWAYVAGSVLQVALVASGFVVPAMFFLGVVFAAIWVTCLVLARRVEEIQRAREAEAGEPGAGDAAAGETRGSGPA